MPKFIDLVGQRFGRLIVIRFDGRDKWRKSYWLCRCDCGKEKIIGGNNLRSGNTKSCGCLAKNNALKHGHTIKGKGTRTYESWHSMIQRCTNPKDKRYKDYGGRGITVCERWLNSFPNFLEDMGDRPKGHQIDRMNNDKGYHKSNCCWITPKEQQRNKRNNLFVTHGGERWLLIELCEKHNMPYSVVKSRIYLGWPIEKALKTPVRKCKRKNEG